MAEVNALDCLRRATAPLVLVGAALPWGNTYIAVEAWLPTCTSDRAHHGRWTRGLTPEDLIGKPKVG